MFYKICVLVLIFSSFNQVLLLPVQQTEGTKSENLERIPRRNEDVLSNLNANDDRNLESTLPETRGGSSEEDYSDFRKRDITEHKIKTVYSYGRVRPEDLADLLKKFKEPTNQENPLIPLWEHPYLLDRQDAEDNDGFEKKEPTDASEKKDDQRASTPNDSKSLQEDSEGKFVSARKGTVISLGKHMEEQEHHPANEEALRSDGKEDKIDITSRHMPHHGSNEREANAEDTTNATPRHMTHHSLSKREANAAEITDTTVPYISHHSAIRREANAEDTTDVTPRHMTHHSSSKRQANVEKITDVTPRHMTYHSLNKREADTEDSTHLPPRHITHHSSSEEEANAKESSDVTSRDMRHMLHHLSTVREANVDDTTGVTLQQMAHQHNQEATPRHMAYHTLSKRKANTPPRNHKCDGSCTHENIQRSKRSPHLRDDDHLIKARNAEAHNPLGLYEGSSTVVTTKRNAKHENTHENGYMQASHVCDDKCNHEHHQYKRSLESSSSSSEEEDSSERRVIATDAEHAKIHARHHSVDNQETKPRNEDDIPMIVEPKNGFSYQEQNPFTKGFPEPRQENDYNTFKKFNNDGNVNGATPQEHACDEN